MILKPLDLDQQIFHLSNPPVISTKEVNFLDLFLNPHSKRMVQHGSQE